MMPTTDESSSCPQGRWSTGAIRVTEIATGVSHLLPPSEVRRLASKEGSLSEWFDRQGASADV